jgi:hypothetical protein
VQASPAQGDRSEWLERMQRVRPRHAAITRNLQTWSSYKTWAEQVRDSWESGSSEDAGLALAKAAVKK